jgi:uncharacterized protein YbjQ (UPF0145 family)
MTNQQQPITPGQPPQALVAALRKLLRPLVRLLLSFQITYPFLVSLLKSIYVDVADNEFSVDGKRQSDSRITLLTGVHRKDVKRLRSETSTSANLPRSVSIGAQLIAYWLGSPQFLDDQGKPMPLPMRAAASPDSQPTFDDLVELVCRQDIRPRVILDDWIHLGVAHLDEADRVVLNTGAFTPDKGFNEKVFFFGKNLHDHIAAGTHNLLGNKPAYFDRSVYYDKLSEASLNELHQLATELGMQALINMNSKALALQQKDASSHKPVQKSANYRMNFGIFHYNNLHEKDTADAPDQDKQDA